MFNISSAMAGYFAAAATEMTTQITELGSSPLKKQTAEFAESTEKKSH
jgi:coenzyme F420-reducing hydrogenase delta subunit